MAPAVKPTPPAEASVQAAVRVVEQYYAALAAHDYRVAHAMWPNRRTISALQRGYAQTAWVKVTPQPPYQAKGGAGSIYATIQVKVDARLTNGVRQHFVGSYTLRRVNDVDGATSAQRRWHLTGGTLHMMPAGHQDRRASPITGS